ncbi:C1 family peptidase [Methanobrevibacter sp.]|uniref:C1 family peptidase n=1 Tax=Methanobrevibacter sp. TaxID=66852 RepID=UPI00386B662C
MSVVLLLLVVIPSTFAIDAESLNNDTSIEVETSNLDDNVLQAGSDIYFDASVEKDNGDGSMNKPYKYLTSSRLKSNSNIHLANGEYNLDKRVSIYGVTITGNDTEKTIIKYNGYAFNVQGEFTLNSVTLNGINIVNRGDIIAKNTIFANGKGYTADSYGNNFGGAIYSPYESDYYGYGSSYSLELTNCTFINNTAEYGGAIYMDFGILSIEDSTFINNTAFNYGGALALEYNQRTTISNTKFRNDKSENDAGGAVYLRESPMTGTDLNFNNCSATFGAGITSLNSAITLKSVYGDDNTVTYNGGVIFHMYGSFSLIDGGFNNNRAHNGGALFIDNSTSFTLMNVEFTNNQAEYCAGAVYSLLNNLKKGNSIKDAINQNKFENNSAAFKDDEYEVSKVEILIGDGNYTMFKVNETEITTLPSYYSLLDYGLVTPIKNQETSGNCWAYTAIATIESCILKASGDGYDLSEEHMKNIIELYSDYGWAMDTNGGGYDSMPIGYLVSWLGPINETEDLTDDKSTLSPVLNSLMHIQNVVYLGRDSYTDNDAIKEAIMKYGAVATGIYYDDGYRNGESYYYYGSYTYGNHAVTIVGWDDNYSKNKFYGSPKGNGAWIVKNSWGTDWGNNGYFYVSYYDTVFAKVGQSDASYTFILNDTIRLEKNYQYDIAGKTDYFYNSSSEVWYKNAFKASDNELLAAVSTYFEKVTEWDVSVYVNDVLKTAKSGVSNPGYYTINLDNLIPLSLGDIFEVAFHIKVDEEAGFPISEKVALNKVIYDKGTSFVSYDGVNWKDLYDLEWEYPDHSYTSQVACIKAFTVLTGIETVTSIDVSYDKYNPVNLTATIIDQYGKLVSNGNVTFSINGIDYVVNVTNGTATLIHEFDKKENEVSVLFEGIGYDASANSTNVEISLMNVDLSLEISNNLNYAMIDVSTIQKINTTVLALVNSEEYNISLINGKGSLKLEELDKGNYIVEASIPNKEIFDSKSVKGSFAIDVTTTKIKSENMTTDDYSNENYAITLTNKSGGAIANMDVKFVLNGETFNAATNNKGQATIPINLAAGNYNITIIFEGKDDLLQSEVQNTIKVKDKVNVDLTIARHTNNAVINVELSKLINETVNVTVNGEEYLLDTINGKTTLTLNELENSVYEVTANLMNDVDLISNQTKTSFTVNVTELNIISNDMVTSDFSGELYSVTLTDQNNKVLPGRNVEFYLNGKTYNATTDENGVATVPITLDSGNYNIITNFNGDEDFFETSGKSTINVKTKLDIDVSVNRNVKDVVITFKLSKAIDEALGVVVNGNTYTVKAYNGRAVLSLNNLENGIYDVSAALFNEEKYIANQTATNFEINITQPTIKSSDMNTTDLSNDLYAITFADINNDAISGKKIKFELNGDTYIQTTDSNGVASIPINLDSGVYDVVIKFEADNDYFETTAINKITVEESAQADISLTKTKESITIDVELSKQINDVVNVSVNGKIYEVSVVNGKGSLKLENNANDYKVEIVSDKIKIDSKPITTNEIELLSENFITYYKSYSEYKVTLLNNKQPEVGKTITLTLNGAVYKVETNNNGIASINVNLDVGTYAITAIYGDEIRSQNITVLKTITENKDLKKYYKGSDAYKVKVIGDNGKSVGAGEIVTMTLNGKTYNVTTDVNGYASLNVNLKPKTYTITATYKDFKVSNKFIVKTTLITKNVSKKKSKTVKYTAKVLSTKGKVLKNKKVTFKLKGKTYTAKTNKKGIATISLKNLKVGKYTITSKYGGLTNKNKLTIK